ncbi:nitrite reductase large subunit [Shewanella sp. 10N.286.52.C2]|uniref:nitrite reductase large subunit NirB n=1 Tax=unclassified Shewanella TaxID=196818 RepID=UPI000C8437B7|nr:MULTISPECIES: nitrite reductase large subunit NirB [unclassified Shewanella]MDO6618196.1 nitrite reductase large subunit NirB [Shewanella sp. 6_MG-2023]MDO6677359.1 nitrite reductase large subunit NirB [Shewanella sp. 4_MG-2023]PMG29283.1 nitrite reductase large subunit [Shewanella sp. 10N.286.52.C2]PMI00413.1 nitrite reductase large subunit [Shewanella sp. 10N.286.48.A6]
MANAKSKLVVIGNGMVGHHFIEQLCSQGLQQQFDIEVFGEEPRPAYDRVQLSKYFETGSADELMLTSAEDYQDWGVKLHLDSRITVLDTANKTVTTEAGITTAYDSLVLATGSYPFVPPIAGNDRESCVVYRTIEDLQDIEAAAKKSKVGVVVGGGLLGLEAANALMALGVTTHVVEFAPQLMPVQLNDKAGDLLKSKINDLGVSVHTSKATTAIIDGESAQHRMTFNDDSFLETDMIVFSAGIRPQDALARSSGMQMGDRGGIAIDDNCLTSAPDVYAIGECALWQNRIFGLVAPGYQMARVAVSHLAAGVAKAPAPSLAFTGADMSTKLKLLGVDVAAIGESRGFDNAQFVELSDNQSGIYKKLWLDESGQYLKGAVLVGDNSDYARLLDLYLSQDAIEGNAVELLMTGDETALELKDSSIVCSCHQVTKADIATSVTKGNHTIAEIKTCTRAASGCGGCAPLVKKIMDEALVAEGVECNTGICEHFEQDRQSLYHLCQVENITDFETLITRHGKHAGTNAGSTFGCDICKPAAGSIFASLQNKYVLNQESSHVQLQDTNDAYLGNIQKDGTYSVVPRIAGGEITPDGLIAIGAVAKEYDLYTKITGGQRIDLFGAKLSELPSIWGKLIAAGFETGHAYGKSLRTVKSCVGSTWCRYGVQDSVSTAIDLENRYKGLRAPHKIKFAVSGCTRECAEAQSKDIGVIATDKGWNLYVAGNGGMRPRHGDLFATDLDTDTLVKYIDRVLMFYIKTADKLQRTSVWMESLEGGLAYLQSVVIQDSLGLAAELDSQMAKVVAAYQCEWKTSLEKPEYLARFNEFVNPDAQPEGETHLYHRARQQRFPAMSSTGAGNIAIKEIESELESEIAEELV